MGAHIYFCFIFAVGNEAKTKTPYQMNLQKQIDFAQKIATADKAAGLRMLTAIYRAQKTAKGQNKVQAVINNLNK